MNKKRNRNNNLVGLAPLVLFLSSYAPLFGIIALRQYVQNSEYLHWGYLSSESILCFLNNFGVATICIIFVIFGIVGAYYVFTYLEKDSKNGATVDIEEISSLNDEPLAYLATYIVSIMFQDYSNLSDIVTIGLIFFIIYRLFIHSKLLLVNPILGLKYSIYSISYIDGKIKRQGILITRSRDIQEANQVQIYNIGYQLYFGNRRAIL